MWSRWQNTFTPSVGRKEIWNKHSPSFVSPLKSLLFLLMWTYRRFSPNHTNNVSLNRYCCKVICSYLCHYFRFVTLCPVGSLEIPFFKGGNTSDISSVMLWHILSFWYALIICTSTFGIWNPILTYWIFVSTIFFKVICHSIWDQSQTSVSLILFSKDANDIVWGCKLWWENLFWLMAKEREVDHSTIFFIKLLSWNTFINKVYGGKK